jgi:hypothetical protein
MPQYPTSTAIKKKAQSEETIHDTQWVFGE